MRPTVRYGLAVVIVLLWTVPAHAITLSLVPSTFNLLTGEELTVDLEIGGLTAGGPPSVSTFDIDVLFESTVLTFVDVTFGDQLDLLGLGSLRSVAPDDGVINLFELSLDAPAILNQLQAGDFVLATLHFAAVGAGQSPLTMHVNALGDAAGASLTAQIVATALVNVSKIPEPSTLLLLASGLALLSSARASSRSGRGSTDRRQEEPWVVQHGCSASRGLPR
jgi:hypothetical protein